MLPFHWWNSQGNSVLVVVPSGSNCWRMVGSNGRHPPRTRFSRKLFSNPMPNCCGHARRRVRRSSRMRFVPSAIASPAMGFCGRWATARPGPWFVHSVSPNGSFAGWFVPAVAKRMTRGFQFLLQRISTTSAWKVAILAARTPRVSTSRRMVMPNHWSMNWRPPRSICGHRRMAIPSCKTIFSECNSSSVDVF